jgi:predicted ArsR family transcriptional regulator
MNLELLPFPERQVYELARARKTITADQVAKELHISWNDAMKTLLHLEMVHQVIKRQKQVLFRPTEYKFVEV